MRMYSSSSPPPSSGKTSETSYFPGVKFSLALHGIKNYIILLKKMLHYSWSLPQKNSLFRLVIKVVNLDDTETMGNGHLPVFPISKI